MALVQRVQEFTVPGVGGYSATWDVPPNVTLVRAMIIGAGGGGGGSKEASATLSAGGSGGGGGEIVINLPIVVEPETTLQITLGAKGAKGLILSTPTAGGYGGSTIITLPNGTSFSAAGGVPGTGGAGGGDGRGGDGGGPWGGSLGPGLLEPLATDGSGGSPAGIWTHNGGASGAGYSHLVLETNRGGPAPGTGYTPGGYTDTTKSPGGSGASGLFGFGGPPGDGATPNSNYDGAPPPAGSWGAGGGGGGTDATVKLPGGVYIANHQGDGAEGEDGYVMLVWMETVD